MRSRDSVLQLLVRATVTTVVGGFLLTIAAATAQEQFTRTFQSRGSEDGYIRESSERSGKGGKVLLLGRRTGGRVNASGQDGGAILAGDDAANRQLKGFLSFDTAPLPDNAVILQATLQLTRGKSAGNPSSLGALSIDMKKGAYGSVQTLEPKDFESAADAYRVTALPLVSGSSVVELPSTSFRHVSHTGRTQLRLAFAKSTNRDGKSSQVGFYSGDAEDENVRPTLTLVYSIESRPPPPLTPTVAPTTSTSPSPTPVATSTPRPSGVWKPQPGTSWQWQLTGKVDTNLSVTMYDIDLFTTTKTTIDELKSKGRIVICYFSAGSYEDFRPDSASFPSIVLGKSNGWPGEKWLDVRRIDVIGPILTARLDLAVQKGCDGVEPDNVDGYTNETGFQLSYEDQLKFNRYVAAEAHRRGLSVGLKNDLDQVKDLVSEFDWALNEQCFQYNECEMLLPFVRADKAVFGVEYKGDVSRFCPKAVALNFDWLKKNLNLDSSRTACR